MQENNQNLPQEEDVSDYVNINYDVLLKRIHKTNSIQLYVFSKIRQSFLLVIQWNVTNPNVALKMEIVSSNDRITLMSDINDDQTFLLYLKSASKKIWNVHGI
jgi:hypothetical protein